MANKTTATTTEDTNEVASAAVSLTELLEGAEVENIPHDELLKLLPSVVGALSKKSAFFKDQAHSIGTAAGELRGILPEGEEEEETPTKVSRRGRPVGSKNKPKSNGVGGSNRNRNAEKMTVVAKRSIKSFGRNGGSLIELSKKMLDDGWKTPTEDVEAFSRSVYVSAIRPLEETKEIESFKKDGHGRTLFYRLKK